MRWTDASGITKDIKDLETSHLNNILKHLHKYHGQTRMRGGGGGDCGDMWYDEETIDNRRKIEAIDLELRLRKIEAI